MDWRKFLEWFEMGFFGGFGYLVISLIWSLIVHR